jgi:hypothetical protein
MAAGFAETAQGKKSPREQKPGSGFLQIWWPSQQFRHLNAGLKISCTEVFYNKVNILPISERHDLTPGRNTGGENAHR